MPSEVSGKKGVSIMKRTSSATWAKSLVFAWVLVSVTSLGWTQPAMGVGTLGIDQPAMGVGTVGLEQPLGTGAFQGNVDSLYTLNMDTWLGSVAVQNVGSTPATISNMFFNPSGDTQNSSADGAVSSVLPWEQPHLNTFFTLQNFTGSTSSMSSLLPYIMWGWTSGDWMIINSTAATRSWLVNTYNNPSSTTVDVGGKIVSGAKVAGTATFDASWPVFSGPTTPSGTIKVTGKVTTTPGGGYEILSGSSVVVNGSSVPLVGIANAVQSGK